MRGSDYAIVEEHPLALTLAVIVLLIAVWLVLRQLR
jgi:hypothetical protein